MLEARVNAFDKTHKHTEPCIADATSRPPASIQRIGYLLSQYPAISHTFFLHEVMGLRACGMELETASINRPDRPLSALPETEAAEACRTFYVKSSRWARVFTRLLRVVVTRPDVVVRGLAHVIAMPGLRFTQRCFWMLYLAEALLVGDWMKARNLDHLHIHFGGPVATVGMLTASAWQIPFSLTIHGPEELLNVDANHLREKVRAARFVFCISDFCRSQLYSLVSPEAWDKFEVIRLGVDPLVLTPPSRLIANSLTLRPQDLRLVCTGRMVPEKGHQILIEACKLLRQKGVRLQVVLVGGGPELARLQAYVRENGLAESVTFTGALSHPQTLAHLRRADLFALASFAEGIPVALMEAMSLGVACISTTVAGIPELIRSGIDGLLVPPGNVTALAAALESLISKPMLRKSLGASARQRIIAQYNLPLNQELLANSFRIRTGVSLIVRDEIAPTNYGSI